MSEVQSSGPTAEKHVLGNGEVVWFAYVNGKMLRDKNGVGRRFKAHSSAIKQARADWHRIVFAPPPLPEGGQ